MAKRTLFPMLLVMILLILLTTESIPSAASTSHFQNEAQVHHFAQEVGTATNTGEPLGSASNQPRTAIRSSGGGLYLIK